MGLSREEIKYLAVFEQEIHKEGSHGWINCDEAGRQSGVDSERGN